MSWIKSCFGVTKPIIGMCHLPALPGDPGYDESAGMAGIVQKAERELIALQEGGVDGVLISNEYSLPYLTKTEPITAIAMARIIGELKSTIDVPYGVNVLWDGDATIDLAVATEASFVREVFTGTYASDFGLWNTNVGETARHRRRVGGQKVRLLFNVVPESASYLANRDLSDTVRSTVFNAVPDALCVSGVTAGATIDRDQLKIIKDAAGDTPVIVNTGVTDSNVKEFLSIADGVIIGTFLKEDGRFELPVESSRVKKFMADVRALRDLWSDD